MITLEGVVNNVTFYDEESSYAIIKMLYKGRIVPVKGVCPDFKLLSSMEKAKGLPCTVSGNWKKHPKYGDEFDAETISVNTGGMYFFLANFVSGLGEKLAKHLIETYGEKGIEDILNNNPQELTNVKGIKLKKLKRIVDSWNKYKSLKAITDFFTLHNVSITNSLLIRIYNHFKEKQEDAVEAIRNNPYCTTEIRGIGFKTADKLALKLGTEPYSHQRIKALIDYILLAQANDNGHTYLIYSDLLELVKQEIENKNTQVDMNLVESVLQDVLKSESHKYVVDGDRIGLKSYRIQEDYIRNNFEIRLMYKNIFRVSEEKAERFIARKEQELGIKLGEKQREAVMQVATQGSNVFILCGYAGTGKSTVSKIILDFYRDHFCRESEIVTCAFTGMASKRIGELTRYPSSTIHSLLGYKGDGFEYNKDNQLPYKVILIDEASMINLGLFYALLRAIPMQSVIIMVGDDAQLPPIGEGNVFADLLNKDWIPKVKLDKIYRQSNDSVLTVFANEIRQGKVPEDVDRKDYKDFSFYRKDIPKYWSLKKKLSENELKKIRDDFYEVLQADLLSLIFERVKKYGLSGLDKVWNIQVITPMRATLVGTKVLNEVLQNSLNDVGKQEVEIRGYLLKQYDKVIHLKNQNMAALPESLYRSVTAKRKKLDLSELVNLSESKRVYNGNLGLVMDIDTENEMFSVVYPDAGKENFVVLYTFDDYKDVIDLGYALTVHKTQGNQFDYVFIPVINSFYVMLNNKLMYTAVTRARKEAVLIGQMSALKRACQNIEETVRYTWLYHKRDELNLQLRKEASFQPSFGSDKMMRNESILKLLDVARGKSEVEVQEYEYNYVLSKRM